jgi:conjugative relaxase-like TrwC/TraI family protein
VVGVHGGVKFYRGAARAARAYVERDRSRADDYYLAEGSGVAERLVATPGAVADVGAMTADAYEQWVAGLDVDTKKPKGRLRQDDNALRFVEVVVNGPKTWSLAASLDPEISAALDAAQDRAAAQIIGWVAQHATTRVGPRGRQVQVPVEGIEAAVIRHYTSRSGDPHRHIHLQVNARVFAAGAWRGLHSVGVRDGIEAINGIGHAAVVTDPEFRAVLAAHGYTVDPESGEIEQLAPYIGAFSARAAQIRGNVDRFEAAWRHEHPGEEPGPALREAWDRAAWAQARPDKVVPTDGADLVARWNDELRAAGFRAPSGPAPAGGSVGGSVGVGGGVRVGDLDRDLVVEVMLTRLGAKRSAWNAADLRGQAEAVIAQIGLVVEAGVRVELAEDLTARALQRCTPLLLRTDVPEHVRALTTPAVLDVEADLITRLHRRAAQPAQPARLHDWTRAKLDPEQAQVVAALAGTGPLLVVEGAAGAGKTTTLAATRRLLTARGRRLVVVTPTRKAAEVAARETGAEGRSAAWLTHQHGWRWDTDGHRLRLPSTPRPEAQLRAGDLLLVDEAGMLDQDTALALLTIADETGARIALLGDPHQLPAVGRGGVLDHATNWAHPTALHNLDAVHRFTDPTYAGLSLKMRTGTDPGAVFDALAARGQIVLHASDVERTGALAEHATTTDEELVIADTRDQVANLNAAIRHQRRNETHKEDSTITTCRGEAIGIGDRVATRRNDPDLGVANRQTWTVVGIGEDGSMVVHPTGHGPGRDHPLPASYVARDVELAYATTVHGAQGETVDHAHVAVGDSTGAAAAYVAMTRGRHSNTAHLVADTVDEARQLWVEVFSRNRADLGPAHARQRAIDDIDRYGPSSNRPPGRRSPQRARPVPWPEGQRPEPAMAPSNPGIGL